MTAWTFPAGHGISVVDELHFWRKDSKSCSFTSSPFHGSIGIEQHTILTRFNEQVCEANENQLAKFNDVQVKCRNERVVDLPTM